MSVQHQLADVGIGLHQAMRLGDVSEGEASIDDWAHHTGGEQREHLGGEARLTVTFSSNGRGRSNVPIQFIRLPSAARR